MSLSKYPSKAKSKVDANRNSPLKIELGKRTQEAQRSEWTNTTDRGHYLAHARISLDIIEKAEEVLSPRAGLAKRAGEAKQAATPKMSDADLDRFRVNARKMADATKEAVEANIGELDRHAERVRRLEMGAKMRDDKRLEAVRRARRKKG